MSKYPLYKPCLFCKKDFICHKKQQYEKRLYCSTRCMYESPKYRENQIAGSMRKPGSSNWSKNPELHKKAIEAAKMAVIDKYGAWEDRKVKIADHTLNITNGQLESYRKRNNTCEICDKEERVSTSSKTAQTNKLAVDHDHESLSFRGLLCCDCNRKLGWYENLQDAVNSYLTRDFPNL